MSGQEMVVRGIRGATTVDENDPEKIYTATGELLQKLVEANKIETRLIAAVLFSSTPDLDSAFPARAAREMGWLKVPLFCHVEIDVPDALPRCIRVLMLVNTSVEQEEIEHIYLKGTEKLREL